MCKTYGLLCYYVIYLHKAFTAAKMSYHVGHPWQANTLKYALVTIDLLNTVYRYVQNRCDFIVLGLEYQLSYFRLVVLLLALTCRR